MNAAQVLAAIRKLGLDAGDKRINPLGGGLATGSPWGASGAAHLVDLVHGLAAGQCGLVINPAEGGQAICVVVRKI
jgi:acetyl-CoA acetyltransferase